MMRKTRISIALTLAGTVGVIGSTGLHADAAAAPLGWDRGKAATYLDQRAAWWQAWPKAQRDADTACISCHTMLPYALSRPLLRSSLREGSAPAAETRMIADASRRVDQWETVQPYYPDAKFGAGKTVESRSTEAVLNALVLVSEGAAPTVATRALDIALAHQIKDGEQRGGWIWQNFHLGPWEDPEAAYLGACYMALTLGRAPAAYRAQPHVAKALAEMDAYLRRRAPDESLFNRVHLLWATQALPTLAPDRVLMRRTQDELIAHQHAGGGWRLGDFHQWKRRDDSAAATADDAYATGLALLALEGRNDGPAKRARAQARTWLTAHQDANGAWTAVSVNKQRPAEHDAAHFMDDAATAQAVIALLGQK